MITFLRHLSASDEFVLITVICFGVQIVSAVVAIARQWKHGAPRQVQLSNAVAVRMVTVELLTLGVALWIGSIRGWSLATLGLHISWRGTAAGALLFAVLLLASSLFNAARSIFQARKPAFRFVGMTLPFAVLVAVINPVFEETIQSGYFLQILQHFGMWPAVLASALFTCFLHAYLGLDYVPDVLLGRVIIGLTFWRWRQLWPVIVAHSFLDLLALADA
jgi:hypothetical protein